MRVRVLLAASLSLGCSDGPAGPGPGDAPGTFRATLSGPFSQTTTGAATYVVGRANYQVDFAAREGDAPAFQLAINADGGRPGVGVYAVIPFSAPQSSPTVDVVACPDYRTRQCTTIWGVHADTPVGRLEIMQSTAANVAGTLQIDLRGNVGGNGLGPYAQVLHLSARFNARCLEGFGC